MKGFEWVIAVALIMIGLSCLTMSATWMTNPESVKAYLIVLLQICLWIGVPVIIAAFIFFLFKLKKKNHK